MVIGLFVIVLLGYVFVVVLWAVSPTISILFIVALLILVFVVLSKWSRGL